MSSQRRSSMSPKKASSKSGRSSSSKDKKTTPKKASSRSSRTRTPSPPPSPTSSSKKSPRSRKKTIDSLSKQFEKMSVKNFINLINTTTSVSQLNIIKDLLSKLSNESDYRIEQLQFQFPEPAIESIYSYLEPKDKSRFLRTSSTIPRAINVNILEESRRLKNVEEANKELKNLLDPKKDVFWLRKFSPGNDTEIRNAINKGAQVNKYLLLHAIGVKPFINFSGNNPELVKLILEKGVDPNARTINNNTALINAINIGNISTIEELIKAGANVNLQNDLGETVLMKAVLEKRGDIIDILLKEGADPYIPNKKNETALDLLSTFKTTDRLDYNRIKNIFQQYE